MVVLLVAVVALAAVTAALEPSIATDIDALASAGRCRQIRMPAVNLHHELVHIHSFENIERQARVLCENRRVAEHRCESVVREMRAATYEMAALGVTEAVVNVTLDYSLAFSVTQHAAPRNATQGQGSWMSSSAGESVLRMVTVLPDEPLERTIASHCLQHSIDDSLCSQVFLSIEKMVVDLWGCEDETEMLSVQTPVVGAETEDNQPTPESEPAELTQLTLPLDGGETDQKRPELTLNATQDLDLQVALFCRKYAVDLNTCGLLYHRAENATRALPAFQREQQQRQLMKTFNISSPVSTRLYPITQRVYIELCPGALLKNKSALDEDSEDQVCLYVDYHNEPMICSPELFKDPKYFSHHVLSLGHHVFMFAYQREREREAQRPSIEDNEWIAAVHVDIVKPRLELLSLALNSTVDYNRGVKQVFLSAKLQTWHFDISDGRHRLCVLHNGNFACVNTQAMVIDSDAREDVALNRTMVLHVPIFDIATGDHEVSVMLLDEYTNVLAHWASPKVHVSLSDDAVPLPANDAALVDPRAFVPQRPRHCPEAVSSNPALSWVCDLWRHEWGIFSQNGEDGVLQSIFHHIGVKHREYVEFGTEDGSECNTRYWREAYNWTGLLMDGSHSNPSINLHREFVTAENINALFTKHKVPKEFDLLSIDVDFNDFWILSAIDLRRFAPRVLVIEYNSHVPPPEVRAVKYNATRYWDGVTDFFGVSMSALELWGQRNGYSLVYCESHGVNCFLVRTDVLGLAEDSEELLVDGEELFAPPNFFGKGWSYPNASNAGDEWEWLQ
ncbi:hypothetical protein Gpo141_00001278 [Globisporangium polare]